MWKRKAQKIKEQSESCTMDNKAIALGGSDEFSTGGLVSIDSITYNNIYDNRLTNTDLSYRNYSAWTKNEIRRPTKTPREIAAMPAIHDHIIKLLEKFNDTGDLDELKVQDLIDAIIYMHGD